MGKKKRRKERGTDHSYQRKGKAPREGTAFLLPRGALLIALLLVSVFLVYLNTLEVPFIFDDNVNIKQNPHMRLTNLTLEGITEAGFKSSSSSRPIANISFALNYYFHQYQVMGYHVVNIVVHIATGILLYLFAKATLSMPPLRATYGRYRWIPFFTAFIWLVHPLHTQSVTYIVQRMNSMAAMFYVLSLLLYVRGRLGAEGSGELEARKSRSKIQNPKSKIRKCYFWFAGSVLAWILALGCKQNAAALPFFVILYEWYFFQDLSKEWLRRNFKYFVGAGIVFGIIALMYLGSDPWERIGRLGDYASNEFTIAERTLTQFRVVIYYLSLVLYPHPSRLNLDYDFALSRSLIEPVTTLICLLGIMGLVGLAVYLAKRERLVSFCILWFFGNLIIESSIIPLAIIFEHRTYLPSMMVVVAAVTVAFRYIRPKAVVVTVLCVAGIVYSLWTYERNKVWRDNVTLWGDCVAKAPRKARPHSDLGVALARQGDYPSAIAHYMEALRIEPEYIEAHYNLGLALEKQGKIREAIGQWSETLRLMPDFPDAHYYLGNARLNQGHTEDAIFHFTEALRLNPEYLEPHNNLGIIFARQGKLDEAIAHFRKALRLDPDFAEAHYNLGNALLDQQRSKEAISHFLETLRLKPDHQKAREKLDALVQGRGARNGALNSKESN